jgi:hypothetical protein
VAIQSLPSQPRCDGDRYLALEWRVVAGHRRVVIGTWPKVCAMDGLDVVQNEPCGCERAGQRASCLAGPTVDHRASYRSPSQPSRRSSAATPIDRRQSSVYVGSRVSTQMNKGSRPPVDRSVNRWIGSAPRRRIWDGLRLDASLQLGGDTRYAFVVGRPPPRGSSPRQCGKCPSPARPSGTDGPNSCHHRAVSGR